MNSIMTAVVIGASGKPNQFRISSEYGETQSRIKSEYDEHGSFGGIKVEVVQYGDKRDLSKTNLVQVLKAARDSAGSRYAQNSYSQYLWLLDKGAGITYSFPTDTFTDLVKDL